MKLLTFRTGGPTRAARLEGEVAIELGYPDVGAVVTGEVEGIGCLVNRCVKEVGPQ